MKLLVLCTGTTVKRKSCNPVLCTDEILQEVSTTKNLAITLGSPVYVSPQLLIKMQYHQRTVMQMKSSTIAHSPATHRLRFAKQVLDSWHERSQRHWGREAARTAGRSGGFPSRSSVMHQTPHPSTAPSAKCHFRGFSLAQFWQKLELYSVPLNFGAEEIWGKI